MALFSKGTLASSLASRIAEARSTGALRPIPTALSFVEAEGVRFVIRVAAERGPTKPRAVTASKNPFLPYEDAMFVADASADHVCLLNKFPVVERHLLIVTRAFEDQRSLLTPEDLSAAWRCLAEIDGLVFYNGGPAAGASQPHKHLQLVETALAPGLGSLPIEHFFPDPLPPGVSVNGGALPFVHALASLEQVPLDAPDPSIIHELYREALAVLGRRPELGLARDRGLRSLETADPVPGMQPYPYNLLMTRRFLFVVPRRREAWDGMELNALGYAGAFFVRDEATAERLRAAGPLQALTWAGFPRED